MRKLSPKQKKFCKFYVKMDNGTQAAIKAGYSKKTAKQMSTENLTKPSIKKEIDRQRKLLAKKAKKNGKIINPIQLMESCTRDILFDPINLVDDDGKLLPINEIPKEARLSLAAIEVNEIIQMGNEDDSVLKRKTKYKFADRNKPRDLMAKILGLVNGSGKEAVPEWLREFLAGLLGININIQQNNYGADAVEAGLKYLINSADGMTRGIPSQHGHNLIEADNG